MQEVMINQPVTRPGIPPRRHEGDTDCQNEKDGSHDDANHGHLL